LPKLRRGSKRNTWVEIYNKTEFLSTFKNKYTDLTPLQLFN